MPITEEIHHFKLERLEWKDYRTITTQFYRKLDDVWSAYKIRIHYNEETFETQIEQVRYKMMKDLSTVDWSLFPDQAEHIKLDAEQAIKIIESDRKIMIENNPDIIFMANRNEVKEKSEWTIVKRSIFDPKVINEINARLPSMTAHKIWLS